MPRIDRFSVSLDTELLAAFDRHIAAKGYENRSEAVRDMIREMLVSKQCDGSDQPAVGILTVVCDHRFGSAAKRLRTSALGEADLLQGSLVLPLDEHLDVVTIALRGPADRLRALSDRLQAMRGITRGQFALLPAAEAPS